MLFSTKALVPPKAVTSFMDNPLDDLIACFYLLWLTLTELIPYLSNKEGFSTSTFQLFVYDIITMVKKIQYYYVYFPAYFFFFGNLQWFKITYKILE